MSLISAVRCQMMHQKSSWLVMVVHLQRCKELCLKRKQPIMESRNAYMAVYALFHEASCDAPRAMLYTAFDEDDIHMMEGGWMHGACDILMSNESKSSFSECCSMCTSTALVIERIFVLLVACYSARRCINDHPSLLPQWRGSSPIHYTILSGQARTGVTLLELSHDK